MTEILLVVIGALTSVIVFQQWFFLNQIQTLINKLMSRSYAEFIRAETPKPPKVILADGVPEDLGPMAEYSTRL